MASMRQLVDLGFRRWYERQLIESHAWLVSGFLCLILAVAGLEVAGSGGLMRIGGLALLLAGGAGCWFCCRRYQAMLTLAERLGEEAVCPDCGRYARFEVVQATPAGAHPENEPVRVLARCRRCAAQWVMRH